MAVHDPAQTGPHRMPEVQAGGGRPRVPHRSIGACGTRIPRRRLVGRWCKIATPGLGQRHGGAYRGEVAPRVRTITELPKKKRPGGRWCEQVAGLWGLKVAGSASMLK